MLKAYVVIDSYLNRSRKSYFLNPVGPKFISNKRVFRKFRVQISRFYCMLCQTTNCSIYSFSKTKTKNLITQEFRKTEFVINSSPQMLQYHFSQNKSLDTG